MGLSRDLAEVQGDAALVETVEMQGRLLRALLEDEEALRPVIGRLGGEVAEYYEGVRGEMFAENIELLIFSTPVTCLVVRGRVVNMSEKGGGSDKYPV